MTVRFTSCLRKDFKAFLAFKRSLGYQYGREEFALREFDRFLLSYVRRRRSWRLDRAVLAWLASKPERKAVSMAWDIALFRQFYRYLQRQPGGNRIQEPRWPRFSRRSTFAPHPLSPADIRCLLRLASGLERPRFRSTLYRALLLVLYCTGVRFGEALRLRVKDVDVSSGLLFIAESKGCSRWVPFHRSLARELDQYLAVRRAFAPARPDARLFVGVNRRTLPVSTAHRTICKLFRQAGMKPAKGRVGPRPYDLRHAFANHRLTRWYRQGVDLHARLPWLSAYMGHGDISGTETYLNANPELLALAGDRFRRHCLSTNRGHR